LGFVTVEDVADAHIQTAFPGKDLRDGHSIPPKNKGRPVRVCLANQCPTGLRARRSFPE
jgi:hypothetical protein